MLPRPLRVTSATEHRVVVRRGRRAGAGAVTVHLLADPDRSAAGRSARVGLVVGKVVGNAVTRHRVARQLRHLVADRIGALPTGSLLVVRAGSAAARADLAGDLDTALRRLGGSARGRRVSG